MDTVVWLWNITKNTSEVEDFFDTDHKFFETLGTLHTKTMNRLQLPMMNLDF
jgi:hypothetical protein